jgi:hypothetical protein
MAGQRKRIGPLDTIGSVLREHALVHKELRRGRIEPQLATRLSTMLVNHRSMLEVALLEKQIEEMRQMPHSRLISTLATAKDTVMGIPITGMVTAMGIPITGMVTATTPATTATQITGMARIQVTMATAMGVRIMAPIGVTVGVSLDGFIGDGIGGIERPGSMNFEPRS